MKIIHLLLHFVSVSQALLSEGSLRILCFGDSITAGFTNHGTSRHPYAEALKVSLENNFPDLQIITNNHGLSGDQVQYPEGSYLPRISTLYVDAEYGYDYAIILGGTNDLAQSREPEVILEALQKVWNVSLSHGSQVLALSAPESGNTPEKINQKRNGLNELILNHQEDGFFTLDLRSEIPYFSMPENEKREIWDDGTHFTPRGYDMVGTIIASRLIDLFKEREMDIKAISESEQSEL